jgi:hypothetical protein
MKCNGLEFHLNFAAKDKTIETLCAYDQFALPIAKKTGPAGHPLNPSLR